MIYFSSFYLVVCFYDQFVHICFLVFALMDEDDRMYFSLALQAGFLWDQYKFIRGMCYPVVDIFFFPPRSSKLAVVKQP